MSGRLPEEPETLSPAWPSQSHAGRRPAAIGSDGRNKRINIQMPPPDPKPTN